MTKIHRKMEYALIALRHLLTKPAGTVVSSAEISQRYHTPSEIMARVLQTLTKHGVLRSVSGVYGGYQLARDLSRMNMFELVQVLEGPVEIARCMHGASANGCEVFDNCNIISPVTQLNRKLMEFYQSITLQELLMPQRKAHAVEEVLHG